MPKNQAAATRPRTINTRSSGRNARNSPALAARLAAEIPLPAAANDQANDRAQPARSDASDDDGPTQEDLEKVRDLAVAAIRPTLNDVLDMRREMDRRMHALEQRPVDGQRPTEGQRPTDGPALPPPVGLKPSASGATGHARAVTTVLTSIATQVYQSAVDGHKKIYEFNQALNQEMVDAFLAQDMAGLERLLLSHAAFSDLMVDSCEHLGPHPGCGLNTMLQYSSGRLLKCLRDPLAAKFNKASADAALAQVRADGSRGGSGQAAGKQKAERPSERSSERSPERSRDGRDSYYRSGTKRSRDRY